MLILNSFSVKIQDQRYKLSQKELIIPGHLQEDTLFTPDPHKALSKFKKLEKAVLMYTDVTDLDFLSENPDIYYLLVVSDEGYKVKSWDFIEDLDNLQKFCFVDMGVENLDDFAECTSLRELHAGCILGIKNPKNQSSLKDISAVKNLANLVKLSLEGSFTDLAAISELDNLEELTIYNNNPDGVKDLSFLADNPNITKLATRGINCEDWSFLESMPKLKEFSIEEGVLSLTEIEVLENTGVSVNLDS
jgi:hypothetical protein